MNKNKTERKSSSAASFYYGKTRQDKQNFSLKKMPLQCDLRHVYREEIHLLILSKKGVII